MVPARRLAGVAGAGVRRQRDDLASIDHQRAEPRRPPPASATPDLHQGRPAHPAAIVSDLSSAGHAGADGADDVCRGAAVGADHQAEGHAARDAALAHRPQHRRVRQRSVAERQGSRDHRGMGRWRSARRPRRRRAAAGRVPVDDRVDLRRARSHRPHEQGLHDSRAGPRLHSRRDRRSAADRGSLRQVGPDHSRRVPRRAPRARLRRSSRGHRHRGAGPWHGLERRQLDGPDRIRRRQRRRCLPGWQRQDAEEGIDVPLRGPLSPVRRASARSHAGRHQVLSEGRRADAASSPRTASAPASATTGC